MTALGLLSSVPAAQAQASPSRLTATASPATHLVHAAFSITGLVTPRGAGVVTLQQYRSGHWTQVSHKLAGRSGSYTFSLRASGTVGPTIYRVTRPGSGGSKTLLSKTIHVYATRTAFAVTAKAVHSTVASGTPVVLTGAVKTKTHGPVVLESLQHGVWHSLATAQLSRSSTFSLSHVLPTGRYALRVRKPATATVAGGVSKSVTVVVSAPPLPAAPTASVTLSGTAVSGNVFTGPVTATAHISAPAGVKSVTYSLDGAAAKPYVSPISVGTTGPHSLTVTVTDVALRTAIASSSWTIQAAQQPSAPTVAVALSGSLYAGKYWGSTTATVTVTNPGSGVRSLVYSLDGGPAQPYTVPVAVATFRQHTLTATVTDTSGLTGTITTTWDEQAPETTPPTVSVALTGNLVGGVYSGPVTATINATDSGSGVRSVTYTLDGTPSTYLGPFSVSAPGNHTLTATATDNLGNAAPTTSTTWTQTSASGPTLVVTSDDETSLHQSSPRLVFSTFFGDSRPITPKLFTFTNNADSTVQVDNVAIGGTDAGSFGLSGQATSFSIPAGGSASVGVEFHPTPPTNCPGTAAPFAIGDENRTATLTYTTSLPGQPSGAAALSGINACDAGGNNEPVLDQVLEGLGYTSKVGNGFDRRYLGPSRLLSGDEIISPYFVAANSSQPVSLMPIAHYGAPNTAPLYQDTGWYAQGAAMTQTSSLCTTACKLLWQFPQDSVDPTTGLTVYNQNQKLLPTPVGTTTFTPAGAFGLWSGQFTDVNFSDDALNVGNSTLNTPLSVPHYLHDMRVMPAYEGAAPNRTLIPNTYIVAIDISRVPAYKNNDAQDVVLLLSNAKPANGQGRVLSGSSDTVNLANASVGADCSVTGFDGVLANSTNDACDPGNISSNGQGLQLTSSAGQLANNNQQNALEQTFDASRGAFTISTTIQGSTNQLTSNYSQIAAFFGIDQFNFIKVEAEHNGDPGLTLYYRDATVNSGNGQSIVSAFPAGLTSSSTLQLVIKGNANLPDPITDVNDTDKVHGYPLGQLSVWYSIDGAPLTQIGPNFEYPSNVSGWFSRTAKAGILVSNTGNTTPVTATFSQFSIVTG